MVSSNFSSHILRLTQHNKRNNERLAQLQRCLDRIKGSVTEQNIYNQLHDILRLVIHAYKHENTN